MKTIHICAALLFFLATLFAFLGQSKIATGLCVLSTFIEIIGSAIFGKQRNI